MQRLHFVLEPKTGLRITKTRSAYQIADRARQRAIALAGKKFHACTPFSTAASSSATLSSVEPPNL